MTRKKDTSFLNEHLVQNIEQVIKFRKEHKHIMFTCPGGVVPKYGREWNCEYCYRLFPTTKKYLCPCASLTISHVKKVANKIVKDWRKTHETN